MEMVVKTTGILVIGGGLAGLLSAYTALDSGIKDVTLLSEGGGASTDVFGINILDSQRLETAKDSYDTFLEDTLSSGCGINDRNLASVLIEGTKQINKIINQAGLELEDEEAFTFVKPLGSSYPRCAFYNDKKSIGVILMAFLLEKIKKHRGKIIGDVSITHLLKDNNRIIGAYGFNTKTYESVIIKSKATILATGGFSNIFNFTTTFSTINGGCHIAAYNSGADLVDLEFVQFEPCVCVYPDTVRGLAISTTMLNDGARLYNGNKEEFIEEEYPNKNILSLAMYKEIAEGRATDKGGLYFDATLLDPDFIEKAYSSFISKYKKGDIDIRKDMLQVAPAAHYSCGGVKIGGNCSTSIEGLYACGEVTGGIHGANRIGGNAGAETLVFGCIAGNNASEYINGMDLDLSERSIIDKIKEVNNNLGNNRTDGLNYQEIRKEVRNIVSLSANVIRDGINLKNGIKKLIILDEKTAVSISSKSSEIEKFDYYITDNMIKMAKLLLACAEFRRESRGTHYRSDYPEGNDNKYLGSIIIRKKKDGPELIFRKIV